MHNIVFFFFLLELCLKQPEDKLAANLVVSRKTKTKTDVRAYLKVWLQWLLSELYLYYYEHKPLQIPYF